MRDAADYARRVRRNVGLSQVAFTKRIGVPVDTCATGSKASARRKGPPGPLLRIIDRALETALEALDKT